MSDRADNSTTGVPFTADSSWETTRAACAIAELDTCQARLMRLGENALFHLPADDVVVRIARTMSYWDDAAKEVNVAHWLVDHSFPAAEVHDVVQPVAVADRPVTFWRFITGRAGDERDIVALGAVLRRLHETPPPTAFTLPSENILGRVEPRILVSQIPADDKRFLLDCWPNSPRRCRIWSFHCDPHPPTATRTRRTS